MMKFIQKLYDYLFAKVYNRRTIEVGRYIKLLSLVPNDGFAKDDYSKNLIGKVFEVVNKDIFQKVDSGFRYYFLSGATFRYVRKPKRNEQCKKGFGVLV